MHELAIMEDILNIALDHANRNQARKIIRVNLAIGKLSDIVPQWAQIFFDMITRDTIAENAELYVESIPIRVHCQACGNESIIDHTHQPWVCGSCGSAHISLISGREFRIQSIEVL